MKLIVLTWEDAIKLSYKLAKMIAESGEAFDTAIGISRGGLVPARIVSDYLGIDDLQIIRARLWGIGARRLNEVEVSLTENLRVKGRKVLIIDEVVDTGKTMRKIISLMYELGASQVKAAVLHYKATSTLQPDYYAEKLSQWGWIVYPWSLFETIRELRLNPSEKIIITDSVRRIVTPEDLAIIAHVRKK